MATSKTEPVMLPREEANGDKTDQNNSTSINPFDGRNANSEEAIVSHENDKYPAKTNVSESKNIHSNKAAEKDDQKKEDDDDDDDGPGVKTYSGYVPISQIQWDWEPPTFPSNEPGEETQTKPRPPPVSSINTRSGIPDEKVVYTDVGEKLRPSPYIFEIKKRKFEKKAKNKLFVGGLVFEATKEFLYDQFEKYGKLKDACIVTERGTGRSRGFGYVTFVNQDDAAEAIKAIDGLRINGKTLCVEFADDPKDSPPEPRRRSRSPPRGRFYDDRSPPRGRGFPRSRGRSYDMDRYPDRDPYYDRYPRDPDPSYRRGGNDPYFSPRDFDRLPPPRDYDRLPPPRDYDRPPPRDYYDRPPPRGYDDLGHYSRSPPPRGYDRSPPPRGYDDYRRPPPYDDHYTPPRRETTMRDVDVARLRVDREKVRISVEDERRLQARRGNKRSNRSPSSSSSSSSDSSDSGDKKPVVQKTRKVLPKAYRL